MVKVKEIFSSIQGEGPYVGYKQLFIRLCGCNLKCAYCDTEFDSKYAKEYTIEEMKQIIDSHKDCHSISLTGGEPLLHTDFIKELAQNTDTPLYLETNGTLFEKLEEVIEFITYVSADIKLPSATGLKECWAEHEKFFEIAKQKELFAKVVFNSQISEYEIEKICELCKKFDIELVLQPMMEGKNPVIKSSFMEEVLNSCLKRYKKVRLIPQVHKFIDVI